MSKTLEDPDSPAHDCREIRTVEDDDEYADSPCDYLRSRCVRSPACCVYCQLCFSLPFFAMAAIGTHLWQRFTPVYEEVEFRFGGPKIIRKQMGSVDMNVPLSFENPNPYPIQIHEKVGKILLAHSWHELGQFKIPSALIPPQSEASFSVESEVAIDGVGDILAVTPKLLTPVVEFWFVAEDLKGEAKLDLFAKKMGITIKLSRACSALFNRHDRTTDGDMFCSENRTQLEKRVPAPDLVFPELTEKYEGIKNRAVGAMMLVGYLFGGLLIFFAALTYQSLPCEDERQSSVELLVLIS